MTMMRRSKRSAFGYVAMLPHIARAGRAVGYAITVHGSLHRDLDIVAIPWTKAAVSSRKLAHALAVAVGWMVGSSVTKRPHGRIGFVLVPPASEYQDRNCYIDLSVMPRVQETKR